MGGGGVCEGGSTHEREGRCERTPVLTQTDLYGNDYESK